MIDALLIALDQACRADPLDLDKVELLMRANGVRSIRVDRSHFERQPCGAVIVNQLPARFAGETI